MTQNSKSVLPCAQDWSHYWSLDQTQKFTKVSWSKRRIMRILQPYVGKGKSALDAGCGSGFFSKYFCDAGMDTISIDYSQEALDLTQKATQNRTDVRKLNLVEPNILFEIKERFDVIFTDGLLEHFSLEDQGSIIQNLTLLLKEDGIIATFVPNRFSPWELIRPFYMPGIYEKPFVLKVLVELNTRHKLKILLQGGINTFPFYFSPDALCGSMFGMLLFTIAKKND